VFKTIVVASDGSESADAAVAKATELARASSGRLVLVHVVEHTMGKAAGYAARADEPDLKAHVEKQVADLTSQGVKAELQITDIVLGGPAKTIADVAKQVSADLIVAGTRGHGALFGLIGGSVSQRLLHVSPCPVLIVPTATE
jgi:nucleotide-binding universal stress UspA family protein